MRQEFAMTTVDNRAELEQVEGGIFCPLPLNNINIVYPGCRPYPPPCAPPPCWPRFPYSLCPLASSQ